MAVKPIADMKLVMQGPADVHPSAQGWNSECEVQKCSSVQAVWGTDKTAPRLVRHKRWSLPRIYYTYSIANAALLTTGVTMFYLP